MIGMINYLKTKPPMNDYLLCHITKPLSKKEYIEKKFVNSYTFGDNIFYFNQNMACIIEDYIFKEYTSKTPENLTKTLEKQNHLVVPKLEESIENILKTILEKNIEKTRGLSDVCSILTIKNTCSLTVKIIHQLFIADILKSKYKKEENDSLEFESSSYLTTYTKFAKALGKTLIENSIDRKFNHIFKVEYKLNNILLLQDRDLIAYYEKHYKIELKENKSAVWLRNQQIKYLINCAENDKILKDIQI